MDITLCRGVCCWACSCAMLCTGVAISFHCRAERGADRVREWRAPPGIGFQSVVMCMCGEALND